MVRGLLVAAVCLVLPVLALAGPMIQTAGGNASDKAVVRSGYGDFPANSGNWTVLVRFKYNATVTGGIYTSIMNLFDGATDFSAPYVFLGSQQDTNNVFLEVYDGATFVDSSTSAITNNTQHWAAVTYDASSHVHTLIVDGSTTGTAMLNMSAVTFDSLMLLGDGAGGLKSAISVAYCRAWSAVRTTPELTTEAASMTAVITSGLLWDCPCQAGIDLTSHNNTLNYLTALGTVTTDTTDPLLSVVAAPPTNTTATLATTVTLDSSFFQSVLSGGTAQSVWLKSTATVSEVWSACGFGALGGPYDVRLRVYEGLANALGGSVYLTALDAVGNTSMQFPVTAGNTYYFNCTTLTAPPVTPALLQFSLLRALDLAVPVGSIVVPDDTDGFPVAYLSRTTGYPIKFVLDLPAGEGGNILPNGIALLTNDDENTDTGNILTRIRGLAAIGTTNVAPGNYSRMSSDEASTFFVGSVNAGASGVARIQALTDQAVLGSSWDLPATGLWALGVTRDRSIAYYARALGTNQAVKAFDLINSVALPDLAAGIANYFVNKDILCLEDGTVLVLYSRNNVALNVIQYAANGSVLQTITVTTDTESGENRLCWAIEDDCFWVWNRQFTNNPNDLDDFYRVRVSDGVTVESLLNVPAYEAGIFRPPPAATMTRFGHSQSCPFWIMRASTATNRRGIYVPTRGVAGSEGGGSNARFQDLNGYASTGTASTDGTIGYSTTVGGRIIHVQVNGPRGSQSAGGMSGMGVGRAIYVPPNSEGDANVQSLGGGPSE